MDKWIICAILFLIVSLDICNTTHVFKIERDFSKIKTDSEVAKNVEDVLKKLRTFKVPVHPRVRLLYRLLKRGMARYAYRVSDSLYVPNIYRTKDSSET